MDTTTVTAHDIMTRKLTVTSPETHVLDAIDRLIGCGISGLPVLNGESQLVGRFSERSAVSALDLALLAVGSRVSTSLNELVAADIMDHTVLRLKSTEDVFEGARKLLAEKTSGAPVIEADGSYRGVFSEQSVMHAFIGLCWEQLPSSHVVAWIDRQEDRTVDEKEPLANILLRFQDTHYRRLIVLHANRVVGQVTRRDALKAALGSSREPLTHSRAFAGESQLGVKTTVEHWMHTDVHTIGGTADVLAVATKFLHTAARQLPVMQAGRLVGQISRSDLLRAVERYFPQESSGYGARPLYLTSIDKRDVRSVV